MEILDDREIEEEKEEKKEKKGRRRLPSLPRLSNRALFIAGGTAIVFLFLIALLRDRETVVTSPDPDVVNKIMEQQLRLQREMQKQLLREIEELKKELQKKSLPATSGGNGTKTDVFELLKKRKKEKEKDQPSSMEIIRLKEELRRLREELEERERKKDQEPVHIQIKEREAKKAGVKRAQNDDEKEKKKVFIPAGSVMKGRIVSAFFAPVGGTKFPAVLIELKGDVALPNNYRFPMEGCRVVAKAEGDWVLERAKLETYKLACVLPSGKVVEMKFAGKVVSGVDGGEGVKGRFINASAKQLRTYFGTTFLGTLFESLAQAQVNTQLAVEGGTVFRSEVIRNEGEYAFYSAMAETWKQFSQFYLDQAKKALPVVLVDGNIPIYIEVIDGFSLGVDVDEVAGLFE